MVKNMIKSKICIITTRNIMDAPCLDKYRKIITDPFDIVYWDRSGRNEECGANGYYKFSAQMPVNISAYQKLKNYVRYFRFVKHHLKTHKYEKIIVFPTQAAWLISGKLVKDYKRNYIFDIRDYAGENNPLKGFLTKRIVKNAGLCSLTSTAYKSFLPKGEYVISHNIQKIAPELISSYRNSEKKQSDVITFSFVGTVRFIEQQKKFIDAFKNDKRFHINYIGRGSEQLKEYCDKNNITNVSLVGEFKREDLPLFYANTNAAINVYGNNDPYLDYALSNKLYSSAMMGMPILVSPKTYMEEIVSKYNIGYAVDYDNKDLKENLYNWFMNLDFEKLYKSCDSFISDVMEEEAIYYEKVKRFLNEEP